MCRDLRSGKDLAEEVRQYFIPDFSNCKNHDSSEAKFEKLHVGLQQAARPAR